LAIAAESAKFTMAYTRAGLTPDGSSTFFLPRIVGAKRAMELTLLNRALSAAEACQWGIINRVVSDDKVLETALALAEALAHGPAEAFGRSKRLLLESSHETLESQMEHEAEAICAITGTANAHEGIAAFLEKRAPNFE
jgi:2-(1,2-epoxy-1,2-dihydrophenyl)acetyl-CoA isomerase